MRYWIGAALLALMLLAGCMAGFAVQRPDARFVGTYIWPATEHRLGGFSGLEMSDDGSRLTAISDRGAMVTATVTRLEGRISGVKLDRALLLTNRRGEPLERSRADSEGLAIGPDGRMYVSFEGAHRVVSYADPNKEQVLARDPSFDALSGNSGFEALAIDPQGRLLIIPERSGRLNLGFPVWRLEDGEWSIAFRIERAGGFLPVGADVGPDGKMYVLERVFNGFGFRSRVRRFPLDKTAEQAGELLFQSGLWDFDNLEGLSVWKDPKGGLRLTLISDDNFRAIQKTQIVEFTVPAP